MVLGLSTERKSQLIDAVVRQLKNMYGVTVDELAYIDNHIDEAICRTLNCFSHIKNKYYCSNDINVLHSGQYTIFLYYLANTIFVNEIKDRCDYADYSTAKRRICDKIYCLNKMASSCDVYYEVHLPDYFFIDHPMGSVIGRGKIGDGFCFIQGCTIGGNHGAYPVLGKNVIMYSNSKILGDCHIGNNVLIGANAYVKDMDIPDNSIVYGQYPNVIIKKNRVETVMQKINGLFCD